MNNHNHKFKTSYSKDIYSKDDKRYINPGSYTCLKCNLCFCGCDQDIENVFNLTALDIDMEENYQLIIEEIHKVCCCYISDEEYIIKNIIE